MYVDANVFVFAHFDSGPLGRTARNLLKRIRDGEQATTSALTIDETMWAMRKNKKQSEIRHVVKRLYALENLSIVGVPSLAPLRAVDFIEAFNLKPRDAIHAAIMESCREAKIASFDPDFDRIPNITRVSR